MNEYIEPQDLIAARLYDNVPLLSLPTAEERARSRRNISQWLSYLPEDCVRSMVNGGWDRTA